MAGRNPLGPAPARHPLTAAPPELERTIGYRFARPALLIEALTHRSALQRAHGRAPRSTSNERLEFLGDRVLNLLMAEWLLERYPDEQEGDLGRRQGFLVSGPVVARAADRIGLPAALSIAPGEARVGVGALTTVRSDAMEAVIGAIFLDGGLEPAREFVRRAWANEIAEQGAPPRDAKTILQEWALARGLKLPVYEETGRSGPSHAPEFTVRVTVRGETGEGRAGNKQAAQRAAAAAVLRALGVPADAGAVE